MEEEFRLLTLQVIGEAILSLPPEECDRVSSQLWYLQPLRPAVSTVQSQFATILSPWLKLGACLAFGTCVADLCFMLLC
jgi:hypothetical protein